MGPRMPAMWKERKGSEGDLVKEQEKASRSQREERSWTEIVASSLLSRQTAL